MGGVVISDGVIAGRGEAGGRREDDRQRNTDRDVESGGQKKAWGGNAWAKGKPSSLGGPEKIEILKRKVQVDSEPPVSARGEQASCPVMMVTVCMLVLEFCPEESLCHAGCRGRRGRGQQEWLQHPNIENLSFHLLCVDKEIILCNKIFCILFY